MSNNDQRNNNQKPVMLPTLASVDVIAVDAAVALGKPGERAFRLVQNRSSIAPNRPFRLLITTHVDAQGSNAPSTEREAAQYFADRVAPFCPHITIVDEQKRTETATKALELHRTSFPRILDRDRKDRVLLLGRRGGKGKPEFIAPFTGGAGTTCGTWTPIVAYQRGKTTWIAGTRPKSEEVGAEPIRGFLRGNYAQGVCPAACSFCYLRGFQGMGINYVEYEVPVSYQQFAVA